MLTRRIVAAPLLSRERERFRADVFVTTLFVTALFAAGLFAADAEWLTWWLAW